MKKIIIVGGGASGLMLASLLNDSNQDVTLLEKDVHVGKKILVTGNGKCNLSNTNINKSCYNNDFAFNVSKSFDVNEYFNKLGLLTTIDDQGRIYPYSLQSNSVLDILRNSINNINVITNCNVIKIDYDKNKYYLTDSNNNRYEADILILATGSKSYYKDSNSYLLASKLSHRINPIKPSLLPLKINDNLASIENIRAKVKASLFDNNNLIYQDLGEVLFKKDYLSGIVMFQLSSIINRNPYKKYYVELDLTPDIDESDLINYLTLHNDMTGLFNKMLNKFIKDKTKNNNPKDLAYMIKHLRFEILDNLDFKNSQVTSGGIFVNELTDNLESKVHKNLYFIGEIVDCDGICGGYNLHFAFASAYKAYLNIKEKIENEKEN